MEEKVHKHIFIVGENEVFTKMLDYIFTKDTKYRFLDFVSAEDCLKNLHLNPDLIVMDYNLPVMNGYDALLSIKEFCPACHVIMLIDWEYKKLPSELIRAGANDYIIKTDNLVGDVIKKVEAELEKEQSAKAKIRTLALSPVKAAAFLILLILLASIGFYYYQ